MKKILNYTLASLALAAFSTPCVYAKFGGSIRGDVGMLGNQVPFLIAETGIAPITEVNNNTQLSHRKEGQWDFTGRLFMYTSCSPCPMYIAGSWQGSNHKVHSCSDLVESDELKAIIALRATNFYINFDSTTDGIILDISNTNPVLAEVGVKNKFSKAKLGIGFDLIKKNCFSFTMEVGGNYLDTHLNTVEVYTITQTVAAGPGCINVPVDSQLCSPPADGLPFNFVVNNNIWQKTEGFGLYANFKADYKLPATCLGNCFSIYGKAEIADIIGRQKYNSRLCYQNEFNNGFEPFSPPSVFDYKESVCARYNNVVEVDLEAALVYSPCFRCWNNLNLNFALGARTDSFVNLFSKPFQVNDVTYLSLTRPTVFFEIGIKV